MNKYCALAAALVSLCLLSCKKAEEPVTEQEQDYVIIPDAKFKSYLLEKYDEDKDGNISLNEAKKVKDIDCRSLDITDLTGIRCFSELVSLNCSNNGITNLTLSGPATKGDIAEGDCSNLKNLDCSSNKISSISVSNCPSLETVKAGSNELTTIDVTNNPALTNLDVSDNNITEISVTNNPALTNLDISGNDITTIDVSENPILEQLDCSGNENLTEVITTQNQQESIEIKTDEGSTVNVVTSIDVTDITLNVSTADLLEGTSIKFIAIIAPDDATNKAVYWTSSDASVATVDKNGNVSGIKPGTATITVTSQKGGKTAKCEVNVLEKNKTISVTGISLNKTSLELTEGDTGTLTATITPSNATNKNVSWSSSDAAIASVDSTGLVSAIKPGTATITVTTEDGQKTASCAVTVKEKIYPVESIGLDKTSLELTEGDTESLTATIAPSNATNKNVTWSSSDAAIASVDSTGLVRAIKPGTATITVTTEDGQKTASCAVTVTEFVDSRDGSLPDPDNKGTWEW